MKLFLSWRKPPSDSESNFIFDPLYNDCHGQCRKFNELIVQKACSYPCTFQTKVEVFDCIFVTGQLLVEIRAARSSNDSCSVASRQEKHTSWPQRLSRHDWNPQMSGYLYTYVTFKYPESIITSANMFPFSAWSCSWLFVGPVAWFSKENALIAAPR